MRRLLVIILVVMFLGTANSQTNLSGTIGTDSVLTLAGSPYTVTGDLTVSWPYTLTIDSGVVVRFQANMSLYSFGNLHARRATFTSIKDTAGGAPQKGDWGGIQVGNYSYTPTVTLDTCEVKYGGGLQGEVYIYSGDVSIIGCSISNSSKDGINLGAGALVLSNSNISNASWNGLTLNGTSSTQFTSSSISFCAWPVSRLNSAASLTFSGINNFTSNANNGIDMNFTYSNSMVLDTAAIPYVFRGSFYVNEGTTLTVCAGNVLKFGNGAHLYVNGGLVAVGSVAEKIYFTSYEDDNLSGDTNNDGTTTAPAVNDWGGVAFNDLSMDSICVMKHCSVSFAGYYSVGGINTYNASPTIDSCDMANNHFGAMIQGTSSPKFSNNTIGSSELVPIALSFSANPVFSNNTLSFSDNEYDAIGLIGESLVSNSVLPIRSVTSRPNVTYLLLGTVVVPSGVTLTINKGIVIKGYGSDHRIAVQGKLVANGTADSMIVFTSAKDDNFGKPEDTNKDGNATYPEVGNWSGIVFEPGSDSTSLLNYCRVSYARMEPYWVYQYNSTYYHTGAVTLLNASPTISNCNISNSVHGIYAALSSNPVIANDSITNSQFTPIAMSISANPMMSGLHFLNNGWTGLGLIGEQVAANGTVEQRNVAGYTNITYILVGDIMINSGTYVTINPGVVIKSGGPGIYVNGGLSAKGTIAAGRVVFTSLKDDNFGYPKDTNGDGSATAPAPGDWSTVRFQGTSDDAFSKLDSCLIKYGGNSSGAPNGDWANWGLVTLTDVGTPVSNVILSDSYNFGIRCENSSTPHIDNVSIMNCTSDPIGMSLLSNPVFTNITFTANGSKGIRILEGTLSSSAVLATRNIAGITNVAYIIDQLTVAPGAVLTIQPGVVIKFVHDYYHSYSITVQGAFVAAGTATQPIVFTSFMDDANGGDTNNDGNLTGPQPGDWSAVDFTSSSTDSLNALKYCRFRYGGEFPSRFWSDYTYKWALTRIYDAAVKIDSCQFEQSKTAGVGIFGSAHPALNNSKIYNVEYTPIAMSLFSNPTFVSDSALNVGSMALGVVPETYSADATVPVRNFGGYNGMTYLIFGTCTVNTGTSIVVPAGVVFKGGQWVVNGGLSVEGTVSQPVVFTDPADDNYGRPLDTNGDGMATKPSIQFINRLTFNDVSFDSLSTIRYALFRYSDVGVWLQQAAPVIIHSTFDHDSWGICLNGVSTPAVDSCMFRDLKFAPLKTSLVSYPRSTLADSISGKTFKAIGVVEETLVQDVTLGKKNFAGISNIPYFFGNYTVASNAVLTIEPGIILKFAPGTGMTVNRGLTAVGGSGVDSTIVFTDIRDDFYGGDTNADTASSKPTDYTWNDSWTPAHQGWMGISFSDQSLDPLCVITHCVVRYAGINQSYYNSVYMNGAAILTINASPTITYSAFTKNGNGVAVFGSSNPVINYCDIYENIVYGINNVDKSFNVDARWNWWGSNTGPTHSSNPGGEGQTVTDAVDFLPFLGTGASNPNKGDVSLNGFVQAYDASLILRFVVNPSADTLNALQQGVADVSGEMGITAYDASLVLQYVVGLISAFPAEMRGTTKEFTPPTKRYLALQKVSNVQLSVENATANRGDSLVLALDLRNAAGVGSAQINLKYDPAVFVFQRAVTGNGASTFSIASASDNEKGSAVIALAGSGLLTDDGPVAYVSFKISEDVRGTSNWPIEVSKFLANESDMTSRATTGQIKVIGKPTSYALDQNYPNPFNPSTVIGYQLPDDNTSVHLVIYNLMGQVVKTLVDQTQNAGTYKLVWNGTNNHGLQVGSGIYFCRIQAGKFVQTKKLVLLR